MRIVRLGELGGPERAVLVVNCLTAVLLVDLTSTHVHLDHLLFAGNVVSHEPGLSLLSLFVHDGGLGSSLRLLAPPFLRLRSCLENGDVVLASKVDGVGHPLCAQLNGNGQVGVGRLGSKRHHEVGETVVHDSQISADSVDLELVPKYLAPAAHNV